MKNISKKLNGINRIVINFGLDAPIAGVDISEQITKEVWDPVNWRIYPVTEAVLGNLLPNDTRP